MDKPQNTVLVKMRRYWQRRIWRFVSVWDVVRFVGISAVFSLSIRLPGGHAWLRQQQRGFRFRIRMRGRRADLALRIQDVPIFEEVFLREVYRVPAALRREAAVVVDAGAHIGLATLYFWMVWQCPARFVCLEPAPDNQALLRYNLSGVQGVVISDYGLAARSGRMALQGNGLAYNHMLVDAGQNEGLPTVFVSSVDDLLKRFGLPHIDLLKLDIEGMEEQIFAEARYAKWPWLTRYVIAELHSPFTETRLAECLSRCPGLRFQGRAMEGGIFHLHLHSEGLH